MAFESGQTRPLALSADGRTLFATNTPDGRLEILDVDEGRLTPIASVTVGLEPVAVAARHAGEVWVVNHLSDSVSVIDVSDRRNPVLVRTLQVGDEPRDVVFAGTGRARIRDHRASRTEQPMAARPGNGGGDLPPIYGLNLIGDLRGERPAADGPPSPEGRTHWA